jgi:aryl-alcohol dehydrogenase-like predicted oxidoreductase
MNVTRTAFGVWNGGKFMNFGQPIADDRWKALVRSAYDQGVRTFISADVYSTGEADALLGEALRGIPRDSYCLVGCIGHDFYSGKRDGAKGFPRFTDARLRGPADFAPYLRMAAEKELERLGADRFDLVLLHNPDSTGYSSDKVWLAMDRLKEVGLTERLGIAPGPANGFTLDLILSFERFGELIDWAMIILNPFEPWPGSLALGAAERFGVDLITRVVDFGGIFHDDVRLGHKFGQSDHRSFRPPGWVGAGNEKLDRLRPVAQKYGISTLQLACLWNLSHSPVKNVVPTLIEELGAEKPIESKLTELANLPEIQLTASEVASIAEIGNNKGCMALKGGNPEHTSLPEPDRWSLNDDLESVAKRWSIDPNKDLVMSH